MSEQKLRSGEAIERIFDAIDPRSESLSDAAYEEIKSLAKSTAEAQRHGCPCYGHLCERCMDSAELLERLGFECRDGRWREQRA